MPARLINGTAIDRSLRQSGEAARTATLAVTKLHQVAKRSNAEKVSLSELDELSPETLAALTPRQLSLVAWSVGRLKLGFTAAKQDLPVLLARKAPFMDAQGLSMTLWSFASLSTPGIHVEVLAGHAASAMWQMSAQSISNTLWACATLRQDHSPLLLAAQASSVLSTISHATGTQVAANVIWATALLSGGSSPLQEAAARVATSRAQELKAQEAAAILWALAVTPQISSSSSSAADQALSIVSEHAVRGLMPKPLAAAAWAFATLAQAGPFWSTMAVATERALCTKSFPPQELARTCWAFATVLYSQQAAPRLWTALGSAAIRQPEFSPQELAAVSWSMAAARFVCSAWAAKVPRVCTEMNLRAMASVAWSWTTLSFDSCYLEETIMPAAYTQITKCLRQLQSSGLDGQPKSEMHRELLDPALQLVWAFSFARVRAEPLLGLASRLVSEVGRRWDSELPSTSQESRAVDDSPAAAVPMEDGPQILLHAYDIVFMRKPPGWEVDGGKDA